VTASIPEPTPTPFVPVKPAPTEVPVAPAKKSERDLARERNPQRFGNRTNKPEVILPATVHPAFLKACHYLDVRAVTVPVRRDKSADPDLIKFPATRLGTKNGLNQSTGKANFCKSK
jgi:hypothetical protein